MRPGLLVAAAAAIASSLLPAGPLTYPESKRLDLVETLHGVEVADPYRWLEDENSPGTAAWVEAQNRVTEAFLSSIPARAKIRKRLTELTDHERYGVPFAMGGRYFFKKNEGLQKQSVLYTATSLEAEPTVLLNPNTLSKDGTVALAGYEVSDDGTLLAYGISRSGSDWQEWKVREVETGKDRSDHLKWVKFSGAAWTKDNKGFYYSRYDEPEEGEEFTASNLNQKVYYHRLGTPQSEDELVYERPDQPQWGFSAWPTEDGRYLLIDVRQGAGSRNGLFYKDLSKPDAPVVELLNKFDARYDFIDSEGPLFWIQTDRDAPRGRVIALNVTRPDPGNWKTILKESLDTLRSVRLVGDQLVASYMHDAYSLIRRYKVDGTGLGELKLPGLGSVWGFHGKRHDRETFYSFNSFTVPPTIFRHDFDTRKSSIFREPDLQFDSGRYETRQVFYESKDKTKIPMFVVCRKGLQRDASNPTLLYGYGGFGISQLPRFSPAVITWLELGGVYAVANLRGGGEYGEKWHRAGRTHHKQNVFDDFIAAARWLVDNNYTSSGKLAIAGGSNGGSWWEPA